MTTKAPQLLTTEQACQRLQVSRWTLGRWAKLYRVKKVKKGRVVRWPEESIAQLVERTSKIAR